MLNMIPYHIAKMNKQMIDHLKYRVIVFVLPDRPTEGIQPNEIRFPFSGKIVNVFASCSQPGETETFMRIERISLNDLDEVSETPIGWEEVVTNIVIEPTKKTNSSYPIYIVKNEVNNNDYFRITIDTVGAGLKNLTVELVIEV